MCVAAEARNGKEAAEQFRHHQPDVVGVDLRMPVTDGVEVARRIMADAPTCVVMLSGSADAGTIVRIRVYRVAGYVSMPITAEHLVPVLPDALAMFFHCKM